MPKKSLKNKIKNTFFNRNRIKQDPSVKLVSSGDNSISEVVGEVSEHKYSWQKFFRDNPSAYGVMGLFAMSLLWGDFLQNYGGFFQASIINQLPKTEFTGTVSPVEKVPNFVALTEAERKYTFDQIPKSKLIDLPDYNIASFQRGASGYQAPAKDRNAYIAYPVPNLGNYMLDGSENSGSHPGIDIKLPIGTPIRAIASGVVYKAESQPTGFGNFVALAHVGIPDPSNPAQKTTLVSSYSHLSQILVREGDIVKKGDIIGKSGNTGMATAPHLHFQIDRDDAPFHPYWPFSWNDVKKAGISSYFDAVKRGLNKQNAVRYTVHPDKFIAAFEDYGQEPEMVVVEMPQKETIVAEKITPPPVSQNQDKKNTERHSTVELVQAGSLDKQIIEEKTEEKKPVANTPPVKTTTKKGNLRLTFETDRNFIPGKEEVVRIYINDENLIASSGILLGSTYEEKTEVFPQKLSPADFKNGYAEVKVISESDFAFKITADTDFGKVKSQTLKPEIFSDVAGSHPFATAIAYLKQSDIVKGYPDGSFKPDGSLNRAEALKIILTANFISAEVYATDLLDIPVESWFAPYVTTAVKKGIVKGYPDKTFRPGNTISRAEFLKIALLSAGIKIPEDLTRDPYTDVPKDAWFTPYFELAKVHRLLRQSPDGKAHPGEPISRKEAAEVIYLLRKK
jgi:hypothetical protein